MNFLFEVIKVVTVLLYPLIFYKTLEKFFYKKRLLFNLTIIISLFLGLFFITRDFYIFYNFYFLLLIFRNEKLIFIMLSIFLILLNIDLLLYFLIQYSILYLLFYIKNNTFNYYLFISVYFYTFLIILYDMSIFNVFITVSFFYLISIYICKILLKDYYKEMEDKYNNILFSFIHEVKNPLSVVVGYLEIINKKDNYDIYKCLNIIDKEVNESLNIIDEYLMNGRFSMNFDYLDINLLLREVFLDFKKVEKAYGLDLNFYYDEEEVIVFGDYSKLKQVFVNIIKNSIEAKEQEKIMIDIDYRIIRNNIIIDINDNGKGIKDTSLIGKEYYSTKENGNGIGSIFSKKVLNLHKGDIKYISNGKKGCDVRINLPVVSI